MNVLRVLLVGGVCVECAADGLYVGFSPAGGEHHNPSQLLPLPAPPVASRVPQAADRDEPQEPATPSRRQVPHRGV
eukprot:387940-Pyramimonas_sp.AAC.1